MLLAFVILLLTVTAAHSQDNESVLPLMEVKEEIIIEKVESRYQAEERVIAAKLEEQKKAEEDKRKVLEAKRVETVKRLSLTRFAPGWCTSYAANKFPVTWRGNASQWPANAKAQDYKVDKTPEAGALLVTNENSKSCRGCGHVVFIEQLASDGIHVTEMNYKGFGIVSSRVIPYNSPLIRAVIHRL